jgi:serine/threonine-protein kinase
MTTFSKTAGERSGQSVNRLLARRLCFLLLLLSPLCFAATARADSQDKVAAESLFDEGRRLLAAGKFAEACPKFAESQRLDPALGTMLNLADCYEKNGQTATAWQQFREATADAARQGDERRRSVADKRAKALEAKLAKLTIQVPPANEVNGLEVRRDGVVLGRAAWGLATPIDPGKHVVEATAPGKKTWSASVTIEPKAGVSAVTIPLLEDGSGAVAATVASVPVSNAPASTPAAAQPAGQDSADTGGSSRRQTQRIAGIAIGAVGVVGIGVGAAFGLVAKSKNDASTDHCDGNRCDQEGVDMRDSALGMATGSTIAFIAGGVLLAGGAVLFLTAPKSATTGTGRTSPYVALRPGSVDLGGRF